MTRMRKKGMIKMGFEYIGRVLGREISMGKESHACFNGFKGGL